MKQKLSILLASCFITVTLFAQKQSFDIATYTLPKGWNKQAAESAIQISKEDASGAFCLITLYKSLPAAGDSKKIFDAAWESLAKDELNIKTDPEMQPAVTEDGWEVQSGHAIFEKDGVKGIALLVSSTGYDKLVNVLILTNTDAFEKDITAFLESIDLKKPAGNTNKQNTGNVKPPTTNTNSPAGSTPAIKSQFKFNTTNFDDGWTATEQEDWVEATKGNIKVLLHYPNANIKPANTDVNVMCEAAWNVLVAPRYRDIQNYKITPGVISYERPYYAQADLISNATGKKVFVALFKKGNTPWIEVITPDKNTFIQNFSLNVNEINYYSDISIWDKLVQLSNYNKFAIAASDFSGKWSDHFAANTYYANVYTGASAGMSSYSSSQWFEFGPNQTYKWQLVMANTYGGATKVDQAKGTGTFKVLNNWQIYFSQLEGKPKTYDAYFTCTKGGRILWLNDANSPGSGIFTGFTKDTKK